MQSAIGVKERTALSGTGSEEQRRVEVVEGLSRLLADTYLLSLKTHGFHWNVTGPVFRVLHALFEDQYNELWLSTDEIAERIRALGFTAPGTYREFSKLSYLYEEDTVPTATQMVKRLIKDHELVARTARWALTLAKAAGDAPTEDLLTRRVAAHEKTIWMLKSSLTSKGAEAISQGTQEPNLREATSNELTTGRKWRASGVGLW